MAAADLFSQSQTLRAGDARLPTVLTPEEQRALTSVAVSRAVLPGEELFLRGDAARSMYLIDTGEVRLSFDDGLADKLLGPGQYFGEIDLLRGGGRTATVRASEAGPVEVVTLDRATFAALLAESEPTREALERTAAARVAANLAV